MSFSNNQLSNFQGFTVLRQMTIPSSLHCHIIISQYIHNKGNIGVSQEVLVLITYAHSLSINHGGNS